MTACPQCGAPTSHLAGIVLYENRNRNAYPHTFDVCWADNIHRQRGTQVWLPLGQASNPAFSTLEWTEHTWYHFSMYLHGYQLHWWPNRSKVSWHGEVRKGYNKHKAMELARRIAADPSVRL